MEAGGARCWQGWVLTAPATSEGLPLEGALTSPGELDKTQISGPPQSFSFRRPGVRLENVHF